MRIFLPCRRTFQCRRDRGHRRQHGRIDGVRCGPWRAVARIDQLHGARGRHEPQGRQLQQARRRRHLCRFKIEPVGFQLAEHLFDPPAQAIEPQHLGQVTSWRVAIGSVVSRRQHRAGTPAGGSTSRTSI